MSPEVDRIHSVSRRDREARMEERTVVDLYSSLSISIANIILQQASQGIRPNPFLKFTWTSTSRPDLLISHSWLSVVLFFESERRFMIADFVCCAFRPFHSARQPHYSTETPLPIF